MTKRGKEDEWFWWGNLKQRENFGELGQQGRIILKWILNKCDGKEWFGLLFFHDTEKYQAFVNTVMKLRVL